MSKRLLNLCMTMLLSVVSTAAWALSQQDGVYQIGSLQDLQDFAALVNNGDVHASAVLTADIDKGMDGTMIGCDTYNFQGIFDGAGHTITINSFSDDFEGTQGVALFRNTSGNALIQNLKVKGKITTAKQDCAGIVAWNSGAIRNCFVDLVINSSVGGDGTHGGIAAVGNQGGIIEDCLVKLEINGAATTNCGGVQGWASAGANIKNCLLINSGSFSLDLNSACVSRNDGNVHGISESYTTDGDGHSAGAAFNNYATTAWGSTNACTIITEEQLASGQICYQLNTDQSAINWVQEIGVDAYPVPAIFGSGKQVYASGATNCAGLAEEELTYSNEGTVQATPHTRDRFGVCTTCHDFKFDALERDPLDGAYLLKAAADLDYAEALNFITNGGQFDLRMGADITYTAEHGKYIFNSGNWFDGNFDGAGHALTYYLDVETTPAALFPEFGGNKFENVILHGAITTTQQYAGSVCGHTRRGRVNINNVFSDMGINCSLNGDNTNGGLIGVVEDKTNITNCIYAGSINCEDGVTNVAGMCGWSSGTSNYQNCAMIGTINGASGDSHLWSRNPGNANTENCYWLNDCGLSDDGKGTQIEDEAYVENGQLAFMLNGSKSGVDRFYQKLGDDLAPMPIKKEGATIYAMAEDYRCDGTPEGETILSNTNPGNIVLPDHEYEDGFCAVCGGMQEDFLAPAADGWFEIGTPAELAWWSHYAAEHLGASARLTADIDMDGYAENYALVGTETAPFYGCFDGQFHRISNLVINYPNTRGVGLIAVMNSLPEANKTPDGQSIDDTSARNAEGVYIKNVTLDNTCSITGYGYCGLVGMTASWAGHVTIHGVMMEGDVTANGGPNASGVFGCVMGSTCHVTVDNCGMTGDVYGTNENGSFSGWMGSYGEVTNCFAVGKVEGTESDDRYFARYSNCTFTNCYARYGTQVPIVTEEDFESGALAWKANGSQFREVYWYQTVGEDLYPYADPSHGTVIYRYDQYYSIADESDLAGIIADAQSYGLANLDELVATDTLVNDTKAMLEALTDVTTVLELADAFDALDAQEAKVEANAALYAAYQTEAERVLAYLGENELEGATAEALLYYLEENEEPSEENALGTYLYIIENHTATGEQIAAETKALTKWLSLALLEGYGAGADVSNAFNNTSFAASLSEGWTDGFATGSIKLTFDGEEKTGVEAWAVTGDMYQTVDGLKPGYYLVSINGAYRPSNNRYGINHAAGIYANGNFNYFPTVFEDYQPIDDAEDQVNCYLEGNSALDLAIYDDPNITSDTQAEENGATKLGYAVHGPGGILCAANAGRHKVYTLAQVGEDGQLTIGITNPGSNYDSDWTGWTNLKVTYLGPDAADAEEAATLVVDNMKDRARTIVEDYSFDEGTPAKAPNYPGTLDDTLTSLLEQETSLELVSQFSQAFRDLYEGKQAYLSLYQAAASMQGFASADLPYVTKDEDTGEYIETGETVFGNMLDALEDKSMELYTAYYDGSYSIEEAQNPDLSLLEECMPNQVDTKVYEISNAKQLLYFRAQMSSTDTFNPYTFYTFKLTDDIDMAGIAMQPLNCWDTPFYGVFDGQGHAIKNLYINFTDHTNGRCGLFNTLANATIKNLKIEGGEIRTDDQFMGGIAGNVAANGAVIDNVAIDGLSLISEGVEWSGDGTHGSIVAVADGSVTISNCYIKTTLESPTCYNNGGVIGWSSTSTTVKGCLVDVEYTGLTDGCNYISRNPDNCSRSNNFIINSFGTYGSADGTQVKDAATLAGGNVCYLLNAGETENPYWFQTLGQDALPHLFGGDIVYSYGGVLSNDKPNPQLNAFAYNVTKYNGGVNYTLNAQAASVKARLAGGTEVLLGTDVAAGKHSAKIEGEVEAILVESASSLDVLRIGQSYSFDSPYGVAVNNNTASKNFGQVLVIESRPTLDVTGRHSEGNPGALFAFDAGFEPVLSAEGTLGFYGGLNIADEDPLELGGYKFDLKDLRFTEDGRLFVARAGGMDNSSVYEINPDNLDEPWTPVFTGGELDKATGITYVGDAEQNRPAVGLAFEGKGEDLKMYVLGAQRSGASCQPTDYNCSIYNLGTAKTWEGEPSATFEGLNGVYCNRPSHIGIQTDGRGGLWFIQIPSNPSATTPSMKHWDAQGVEDYSSIKGTNGSKMAMSPDGSYFAISTAANNVVLYETNYVPMENGKIFLTAKATVPTLENVVTGMAFDIAGNLYVASSTNDTKKLSRYVIPAAGQVVETPVIFAGALEGDVNADGEVTIADAVTVLNVMAGTETDEVKVAAADVNGDGEVTVADAVTVLNIMAGN